MTLNKNILHNLAAIGTDITDLATDVEGKKYKQLGLDAADLLILNLGPVPPASHMEMMPVAEQPELLELTAW